MVKNPAPRSRVLRTRWSGGAAWFSCLIAPGITPATAAAPEPREPSLANIQQLRQLDANSLRLSHDGNRIAYSMDGAIWVASAHRASPAMRLAEGTLPLWSPSDASLAYYSMESGERQLWKVDVETGLRRQITHLPDGIDPDPALGFGGWQYDGFRYAWSPDGNRLVFSSRVSSSRHDSMAGQAQSPPTDARDPLILTPASPMHWTLEGVFAHLFQGKDLRASSNSGFRPARRGHDRMAFEVNRLVVADTEHGTTQVLTTGENVSYSQPDWSPDGKTIVCLGVEVRALSQGKVSRTELIVIDAANGHATLLTRTLSVAVKTIPTWSPDATKVAFLGKRPLGHNALFVTDLGNGNQTTLVPGLDRAVAMFSWTSASSFAITYINGVSWPLLTVSLLGGSSRSVAGPEAAYRNSLASSPAGDLVWQESNAESPAVIRYLSQGSAPSTLADLNPEARNWLLSPQKVVRWKNRRGDRMEGLLIEPVRHAHRPYAVIVNAYPQVANGFKGEGQLCGSWLRGVLAECAGSSRMDE